MPAAALRSRILLLATACLLGLNACGGGSGSEEKSPAGARIPLDLTDLAVFQPTSPYGAVLVPCVTAASAADSCTLASLPLLAQQSADPSLDEIMDRVAVSHPWMGERFRDVLATLPPDLRQLLKGITAIVIDSDIRPSFYSTLTGALYLDPAHFWLTNEEKATITPGTDFRSAFGDGLRFVSLWRYVRDNAYAYPSYSLTGPETRQIEDIRLRVAALLYHELAHANDFFPPDRIAALKPEQKLVEAAAAMAGSRISDRLYLDSPLLSEIWKRLAAVLFRGVGASAEQQLYSADFVAAEFEGEGASDDYAYAAPYEDVAMLFEEVLMKARFGVDRDIGYSLVPAGDQPLCNDFVVRWGNRNRIGHPLVSARARRVVAEILPGEDFTSFFADLGAPLAMRPNEGWCGNLTLTVAPQEGLPLAPHPDRRVFEDLLPPHFR